MIESTSSTARWVRCSIRAGCTSIVATTELNLSGRDLVLGVQRDYVKAGADVIESNTYGANRVKLAGYGLKTKRMR